MYKEIFLKAGLTPTQADILEYLYGKKEDKASEIAKKIGKSRAMVYKDLEELVALNIVEMVNKPDAVSYFRVGHPGQMEKFFEKKENEIKKDRQLFENYLPDMVSSYNMIHSKPGVKYYEGLEGIIRALDNVASQLKPDTEIISFTKVLPEEYLQELNEALKKFVAKRIRKNVKTRVIAPDTPEGKKLSEHDALSLRETRLAIQAELPLNFPGGEIFIYDDQICALTVENDRFFAFIIQNKSIAQMLKVFFEVEWKLLRPSANQ